MFDTDNNAFTTLSVPSGFMTGDTSKYFAGGGLHSSAFWHNVSALFEIGDAFRGCVWGVQGVFRGHWGWTGCIVCQKRLKLS